MKDLLQRITIISFLLSWLWGISFAWGQSQHTAKLIEGARKEGCHLRDHELAGCEFAQCQISRKVPFSERKTEPLGLWKICAASAY